MTTDTHVLGFVITKDGTLEEFGERIKGEVITDNLHFVEIKKVIEKRFQKEFKNFMNINDIDTLSLLLSTITNSIVFLDTTKYFGNTGCLYLPAEMTEEQNNIMKENEEYLKSFNMGDHVASFGLIYDKNINKNVMTTIKQYESIDDFYNQLTNKKK